MFFHCFKVVSARVFCCKVTIFSTFHSLEGYVPHARGVGSIYTYNLEFFLQICSFLLLIWSFIYTSTDPGYFILWVHIQYSCYFVVQIVSVLALGAL